MSYLTRRSFLKRLGVFAAALAIPIPALQARRAPYVKVGDVVSWIGHCPSPQSFIGGKRVTSIGAWDGVCYPVVVHSGVYGGWGDPYETYCDVDLSDFNRDLPPRFWCIPGHTEKYPNVHTYVRVQRYGESIEEAITNLNFSGTDRP